jgi:hypothetical protein
LKQNINLWKKKAIKGQIVGVETKQLVRQNGRVYVMKNSDP